MAMSFTSRKSELTAQDYALVLATANKSDFVGKKAELLVLPTAPPR